MATRCFFGLMLVGALLYGESRAQAVSKVTLTPGWATFGLSLPQGAARSAVQVGTLATQTNVKNRWPDGSIRFAVITCKAATAGTFDITAAPAGSQQFSPAVPAVSVRFTIGGTVYTAQLPDAPTADVWLSGPQVHEWRALVAPANGSARHEQLRVLFDTRIYNDGQGRLDVCVENVLDRRPAGPVDYSVDIVANGKTIYTHAAFSHRWLTRWRKAFGIGLTESAVVHDFESATQASTIPRFWTQVKNKQPPSMDKPAFDIMGVADLSPSMCDCGGRPEMAPYPDWAAVYLVHQTPAQKAYVLANGNLAGSWPMHVREPEDGKHRGVGKHRLISLDDRPNYWFDNRGDDRPAGHVETNYMAWGAGRPVPDLAHQPSLAFIPYLITGDRYFVDELVFWANFSLIASYNHAGSTALVRANEHRGMAWAMRSLADAAAFSPDGDAAKTYLEGKLKNNLAWFDSVANTHTTPLGHVFESDAVPGAEGYKTVSYGGGYGQLTWALDRAAKLGYPGGTAMRDMQARFVLKLFTSEPDFPRESAMPLWLRVGPRGGDYYTTLRELAAANPAAPRMYNHWVRLALLPAVENKWPRAQEAYDYNWRLGTSSQQEPWIQIADHAGWAILPSPR